MKIVAKSSPTIPACSEESKEIFSKAIERFKDLPQAQIRTEHHLHAGVYSRTIYIPKGVLIIGVEMQFLATEDTWATMFFATKAKTIEEAEKEFCSDPKQLLTNREENKLCQE